MPRVVALVGDLMDRSRITAAMPGVEVTRDVAATADADVVVVDLGAHAAAVAGVREHAPDALVVAYGAHVDRDALDAARAAGADRVLPRSRFFADPAAATAPEGEEPQAVPEPPDR